MTPLLEELIARIRAGGPISVAGFMAACLGDPRHGYYTTQEPFGRGGAFVTAPEISQMFGELIGVWAMAVWQAMGSPSPFVLAELGPGRGTLMADVLRAARIRSGFGQAAQLHLVETSRRLREEQRAALGRLGKDAIWHDDVATLPAGPTILLANEFFDALPIRQFARTADGWAERMIGLGEDGRLAFGLRPAAPPRSAGEREGDVIELSPASTAIVTAIAARLRRDGGAALIIDYGYEGPAVGDTLQALRAHRFDDPLAAPGEADLTAHVDFGALADAARSAGAAPRAIVNQGDFLMRLGLRERATALGLDKDEAAREEIAEAVERLAAPQAMGTLFKVLAISARGLVLPVFDDTPSDGGKESDG